MTPPTPDLPPIGSRWVYPAYHDDVGVVVRHVVIVKWAANDIVSCELDEFGTDLVPASSPPPIVVPADHPGIDDRRRYWDDSTKLAILDGGQS